MQKAVKNKAKPLLKRSYEAREVMALYSSEAISQRHGVSQHTIKTMRAGRVPKHITPEQEMAIRLDFMRLEDLQADYLSLDDIALKLCVSRSLVRKWSKEFGFTAEKPERARAKPEPVKPLWVGTAVGRFVTMQLTRYPAESVPGYY